MRQFKPCTLPKYIYNWHSFTLSLIYFPNRPKVVVFLYIFMENSNNFFSCCTISVLSVWNYSDKNKHIDAIGKLEHVSNEQFRLSILYRVRCSILSVVWSVFQLLSFTSDIISFQFVLLQPANMRLTVWTWKFNQCCWCVSITGQKTSWDFIVLYPTFDWLNLKCWNLLFQFCPVIGFLCLGDPGFCSRTVILSHTR